MGRGGGISQLSYHSSQLPAKATLRPTRQPSPRFKELVIVCRLLLDSGFIETLEGWNRTGGEGARRWTAKGNNAYGPQNLPQSTPFCCIGLCATLTRGQCEMSIPSPPRLAFDSSSTKRTMYCGSRQQRVMREKNHEIRE